MGSWWKVLPPAEIVSVPTGRRINERLKQASEAEQRLAGFGREQQSGEAHVAAVRARLEEVDRQLADAEALVAERHADVERAESANRAARARVTDLTNTREQLAEDRQRLAVTLAGLRETKSSLVGRIAVLEELQARGEGFGIGVREILRRARTINDAPWNRIYGTVADLLDVDLEEAPLLEVALGDRAHLVVIEDFHALIPYLGRASSRIQGRVGFLSDRGLPHAAATAADMSEFAGVRYLEANVQGSPATGGQNRGAASRSRGDSSARFAGSAGSRQTGRCDSARFLADAAPCVTPVARYLAGRIAGYFVATCRGTWAVVSGL